MVMVVQTLLLVVVEAEHEAAGGHGAGRTTGARIQLAAPHHGVQIHRREGRRPRRRRAVRPALHRLVRPRLHELGHHRLQTIYRDLVREFAALVPHPLNGYGCIPERPSYRLRSARNRDSPCGNSRSRSRKAQQPTATVPDNLTTSLNRELIQQRIIHFPELVAERSPSSTWGRLARHFNNSSYSKGESSATTAQIAPAPATLDPFCRELVAFDDFLLFSVLPRK